MKINRNIYNLRAKIVLLVLGSISLAGIGLVGYLNGDPASAQSSTGAASTQNDASPVQWVGVELSESEPVTEFGTPLPTVSLADVPLPENLEVVPQVNPIMQVGQKPNHQLQTYVVQRGDTPNNIAERFGIRPETLLGGNSFLSEESSLLQTDTELVILPIDGVLHEVQFGDTLESLSTLYGVPVETIVAYEPNNLAFPFRLHKGSEILVPGAVRQLFVWTPPKITTTAARVVGTGTFVQGVTRGCITQAFLPWHGGLDIGLPVGTPVYAMDTGTVTYASWAQGGYYDYGNLIVIDHGNGFQSFYAHLDLINVSPGQVVRQGNRIGTTGNSGRSSGPHIHFEIRLNNVQDDPAWYIQGGYPFC